MYRSTNCSGLAARVDGRAHFADVARTGISNALPTVRPTLQVERTAAVRPEVGPPVAPGSVPEKAANVHGVRFRPHSRARSRARARWAHIARSTTQATRQPLYATRRAPAWALATQAPKPCSASCALTRGGGRLGRRPGHLGACQLQRLGDSALRFTVCSNTRAALLSGSRIADRAAQCHPPRLDRPLQPAHDRALAPDHATHPLELAGVRVAPDLVPQIRPVLRVGCFDAMPCSRASSTR